MSAFTDEAILKERFWKKVIRDDPKSCWLWIGSKRFRGYGELWTGKRTEPAHRLSYQWFVAPIPEGFTIDHICRNPPCINPDHLRVMTMMDNIMLGCDNAKKTHCPQGHSYDDTNTGHYKTFRFCRACKSVKDKRRWVRVKDKRNAVRRDAWRKAKSNGNEGVE